MLRLRFVMCEVVRFDHVTLAPVQAASAVATDTPPLPLASQSKLASQRRRPRCRRPPTVSTAAAELV